MNPIFKKRMMNLAGIKNDDFVEKNQTEKAADDYFGMNDEVEWDNKIQGFNSLIKNVKELNKEENVESLDSINKRASMLYPGKKYKYMYAGEQMMESKINNLKNDDIIDLSFIL